MPRIIPLLRKLVDLPDGIPLSWTSLISNIISNYPFKQDQKLRFYLDHRHATEFSIQVMQKQHDILDRNATLWRACTQALSEADADRLQKHGIGSSALGLNPPAWMVKWAALILSFIEVRQAAR